MAGTAERRASRSRGFTLLEVLVALAVFSIALVVVMEVFSANLRNLSVSEQQVYATARAESMMRERIAAERISDAPDSGQTEDGYRYRFQVVKILEDRFRPIPVDLYQISLTVSWTEGRHERSISLVGCRMQERKL